MKNFDLKNKFQHQPFSGQFWLILTGGLVVLSIFIFFAGSELVLALLGGAFLMSVVFLMLVFARQQNLKILKISRENEMLLDDLIHNQPSGVYRVSLFYNVYSKTGKNQLLEKEMLPLKFTFISKQLENITGISKSELIDNPDRLFQAIHKDDRSGFINANIEAIERIKPFHWEGRMICRGEVRWMRYASLPRLNPPDNIIWTGVLTDITPEKELEIKMKEREGFEKLLSRLSSRFVSITYQNCDQVLEEALGKVGSFCKTDRAYVFLLDKDKNVARNTHEWCAEGIEPQKEFLQHLPCSEIPQWINHLKQFNVIDFYDVSQLPEEWSVEKGILEPQGVKSLVVVPMVAEAELYGFVGFDSVQVHRKWKDFEVQLLRVFADLLLSALEKQLFELNLIESQTMLRTVLDSINVRVYWKDIDLKYKGCNSAFIKDAGLKTHEEIIGKDDEQLPWKDKSEDYREKDLQIIRQGYPVFNSEEQQTTLEGNIRWVNISRVPLRSNKGEIIGVLGTYQDISEPKKSQEALKASEKRYRILTENAFDGIYLLRDSSFEYVNQRFCEITGYSYEQLTAPDFDLFGLFAPESRRLGMERRKARSEGVELPSTYEFQLIKSSGEIIDVEVSTNKLSTIGEKNLILGIMRDITERKHLEKLRNEILVANQSATFKQNFLANMSHEIRTPLTGVLGMIELLSSTDLNEQQQDFVNTLTISTENLRVIINQILDYSKIEAGEVKLKKLVFETNSLFTNARNLYQALCQKDVLLKTDIHPDVPDFMEADEQRLSQVLNNLVSNAIKFTEKGQIVLTAEVVNWIDENDFIMKITVNDTGIGIKQKALDKLFKPFSQIDHEDKRHFEGTGLGLSISNELVKLMNGSMGVTSKEGEGSSFWFTFHARKAVLDFTREKDEEKVIIATRKCSLNILYAEDKVINQKVVKLVLASMGHRVNIVNNGEEALNDYKPGLYDLILMDIQMPVMDGITATQKLRERYSKLPPVVGLSANAFEGDREKYMKQGLDEYITKPVSQKQLQAIIEKLNLMSSAKD